MYSEIVVKILIDTNDLLQKLTQVSRKYQMIAQFFSWLRTNIKSVPEEHVIIYESYSGGVHAATKWLPFQGSQNSIFWSCWKLSFQNIVEFKFYVLL